MPDGVMTFAKFADSEKQIYLDSLEEGITRENAAKAAGVSAYLVREYRKTDDSFAADERAAERRATGKVENALFQAAISGNVAACFGWLYNKDPKRWKDKRNVVLDRKGSPETQTNVIVNLTNIERVDRAFESLVQAIQGTEGPLPPDGGTESIDPAQLAPALKIVREATRLPHANGD